MKAFLSLIIYFSFMKAGGYYISDLACLRALIKFYTVPEYLHVVNTGNKVICSCFMNEHAIT